MSLPALKPCPFCGCREIRILPQPDKCQTVNCQRCYAEKYVVSHLKISAIAAWNQRREPDPPGTPT